MDLETRRRLHAINLAFYAERADDFAATRDHPWPGWERVLEHLLRLPAPGATLRLLDVGCGNGRFADFLAQRLAQAREAGDLRADSIAEIDYVGVDASEKLLALARERTRRAAGLRSEFALQDFLAGEPGAQLPAGPFEAIVLFGVLHHVAGLAARRALLAQAAARLAEGGVLAFTVWRFAASPRLCARCVAWGEEARAGFDPVVPRELEPGDHLLRWGAAGEAGAGLRYCHDAGEAEIEQWLAGLPLEALERFRCDGRSGDLNEYRLLRAPVRG